MNLMILINLWLNVNYQITTKYATVAKSKFFHQINTPSLAAWHWHGKSKTMHAFEQGTPTSKQRPLRSLRWPTLTLVTPDGGFISTATPGTPRSPAAPGPGKKMGWTPGAGQPPWMCSPANRCAPWMCWEPSMNTQALFGFETLPSTIKGISHAWYVK